MKAQKKEMGKTSSTQMKNTIAAEEVSGHLMSLDKST
jgi:hypothetical protein